METDFEVVCILIKRSVYLEHDGVRRQEWNPVPEAVKKAGDVFVTINSRIYFIYLGVPRLEDFHAGRVTKHLEWCRQAELALKEYFRKNSPNESQLISGPDGISQHELGELRLD